MINQKTIDEVLSRTNIVDIIGSYVKLTKKGSNYFGLCPFHNEDSPSFCVNESRQIYNCFGCHKGGNVIKFMQEYEHFSFVEAVKFLAEKCNVKVVDDFKYNDSNKKEKDIILEINKKAAEIYYKVLTTSNGKEGYSYFKKRKLEDSTITHFGLGFAPHIKDFLYNKLKESGYSDEQLKLSNLIVFKDNTHYDFFRNKVIYPIMNTNNSVIAFGGRVLDNSEPKYINSPNSLVYEKEKNVFALNFAKSTKENYFLLCEGYMDVISLHQKGFTNAIASLGTALTENQSRLLTRYKENVYICYDSDKAGVNAALRAINLLRDAHLNVKVIDLSPYKDPDEFILNLGKDKFLERINQAKNFFLFQCEAIKRNFDLHDPTSKTHYYKEIVKLLSQFKDNLEKENYIEAVCQDQNINKTLLKEMLNNNYDEIKNQSSNEHNKINRIEDKIDISSIDNQNQNVIIALIFRNMMSLPKIKEYLKTKDFLYEPYQIIYDCICTLDHTRPFSFNYNEMISLLKEKNNPLCEKLFFKIFSKEIEELPLLVQQANEDGLWRLRTDLNNIADLILKIKRNTLEKLSIKADINEFAEIQKEIEKLKHLKIEL